MESFFFLGRRGRWRRPGACDCGCVSSGVFASPGRRVLAGAGRGCPTPPGRKLVWGPFGGPSFLGSHRGRWAAPGPAGVSARGRVCLVSKVHVANRRQPPRPPPRCGGAGEGAAESDSCGWGQREGPGAGRAGEPARVPLSFGTKESLSLRHLSLPGGSRKRGSGGWRPKESLCAPGPSGRPSVSRASGGGNTQVSRVGGGQHGVWAQVGMGGGGRCGGGSPAPSPPLPLRAEFRAQSRARRLGRPRAPKSQSAPSRGGRGWEPNFFLPRDRHVSFPSSRAPAPPDGGPADELERPC